MLEATPRHPPLLAATLDKVGREANPAGQVMRRLREFYDQPALPGFVACTTAQPFDIADGMTAISGWTPWTLPGMKP